MNSTELYISKSKFKPIALKLFREIERTGKSVVITDRGQPVLKIVPYKANVDAQLKALRGTVTGYQDPMEPVGIPDWEALT
jgi:antitoxin (DNA-binding transcriptional repressor) of toxin-antitoxin stability system